MQDLKHQANLSHDESGRFTFHRRKNNSTVWRFETNIDGEKVALVFPPKRLENYISVSREELRKELKNRLGQLPNKHEKKVHFNNPKELEDWLSQHPEEASKAVLHFSSPREALDWSDQHPEYSKEEPKFGISVCPIRISLGQQSEEIEEMESDKEFFKKRVWG